MSEPLVAYELADGVALLRLNDPATLNALSDEMVAALNGALDRATAEGRAVVLTGAGRGFSSGANLAKGGPADVDPAQRDAGLRLEKLFNPLLTRLRDLPVPFITAVNGAAAGIGCSFALVGDMIVAAQSACFIQAFSKIALAPDGGSAFLLAASIGRVRAMEMMLLGDKIGAAQALEWGLINRVVPDEEVVPAALELAARLAKGPTETLGMTRKLAWAALESTFAEQLALERDVQKAAGQNPDFDEGVAAFREKRQANFKGRARG